LNGAANFLNDFDDLRSRMDPAFDELKARLHDNPDQVRLIDELRPLVTRRLEVSSEMIERKKVGDIDGINTMFANAEGRAMMRQLNDRLDRLLVEEERLLAIRTTDSQRTGLVLISIDLAGASIILLLV